jgi:hypothetical protein
MKRPLVLTAFAAFTALLAISACGKTTSVTQVMVLVDADADSRSRISSIDLEVRGGSGKESEWTVQRSQSVMPDDAKLQWPIEIALVPLDDDASRRYEVDAIARDAEGAKVGEVRAVSGYVEGRTLSLWLRFDEACLKRDVPCGETETCRVGHCVDRKATPCWWA